MNAIRARADTLWTSSDVAAATGGRLEGASEWKAEGVSIDSRTVQRGDLFVAIVGPNANGHDHVADALAKGAVAALVAYRPAGVDPDAPLVLVKDTMNGLEDLARHARARTSAKIVGVTGSVGKTGTKEMLRVALGAQLNGNAIVSATLGNLNNHWGLPLSLARVPAGADYAVLEMGMNHAGEIDPLSRLAQPDVAVITAVKAVHIEFFDGIEGIADAKSEIFAGVVQGGAAVVDRDSVFLERLTGHARAAGIERIVTFGDPGADVAVTALETDPNGSTVEASIDGKTISYRLGVPGEHVARNSLAVLAALHALDADVYEGAAALASITPTTGRGKRTVVNVNGGTFVLIDESYNASPASMAAALKVAGMVEPSGDGRRIAVIGDMLELGHETEAAHMGLLDDVTVNGIDRVYCAGRHVIDLWRLLPDDLRGAHDTDPDSLAKRVAADVRAGDVVMVKGSLGSRVGAVVKRLKALEEAAHEGQESQNAV